MFADSQSPTGLLVADGGKWANDTNLGSGSGNFYLKPNGVFFLSDQGESLEFAQKFPRSSSQIQGATQSGPLLIANSKLQPSVRQDSASRNLRSAVGIFSPTDVCIAISQDEVTFFELARFFAVHIRCSDVLYLDGAISVLDTSAKPNHSGLSYAGFIAVAHR